MTGETAEPLRTLIVDDEPLAIERMQVLCTEIDALAVVGTASDGEAALRLATKLAPDLVLLDMTMPGMDGLAVARELRLPRRRREETLSQRGRGEALRRDGRQVRVPADHRDGMRIEDGDAGHGRSCRQAD